MQVEVKTNLSRALELPEMRKEIIQYLDDCDLVILTQIGKVILNPDLSIDEVEQDNGAELTERLIDSIKLSSWETLSPVYNGINQE
jgi:hypothetical protein